jgi:superfamily II DNA or RNA helicase
MDLEKDMGKMDSWSDGELSAIKNENLDHLKKKEEIKELISNAKGIYFDEAHHAAAKVCEEVITKSKKAYYCFGGTATPSREDNADLMLEGLFGSKRGNITASFLIKKGHLVRPEIYFLKLKKKGSRAATYDQDYKENLMYNEERNKMIIAAAEKMKSLGLPTLILVQRIDHGKLLESMIQDSIFIHGSSSKDKRSQILKDFENGNIKMLIASTIADEGLDLPVLEALIHGGGGRSRNRIRQRVGRVIRTDKNKPNKRAIVIDFEDNGYYISKHSRERKKVLQLEEEFSVSTINGLENIPDMFMKNLF